jgi:N-acetylmuramoyl-L-alanine amidase
MMRRRFLAPVLLLFVPAALHAQADGVDLAVLLEEWDAVVEWNPVRESGVILSHQGQVAFQLGTPWVLLDFREKLPIDAPYRAADGAVLFTASAADRIRLALRPPEESHGLFRAAIIVIDPGHGGMDPGTIGEIRRDDKARALYEKDVTVAVGNKLSRLLSRRYPGKQVVSTRTDDTHVVLEERSAMANALLEKTEDSILFLSLHANASFDKKARGFEAWVLPPEYERALVDPQTANADDRSIMPILNSMYAEEITVESIALAQEILKGLSKSLGGSSTDRGLKKMDWSVVRNSKMPAVLVEFGFLSHPEEAAQLGDDGYLNLVAEGIYNGVVAFITRFEHEEHSTD